MPGLTKQPQSKRETSAWVDEPPLFGEGEPFEPWRFSAATDGIMLVVQAEFEEVGHYSLPASRQIETARERFTRLAGKWRSATRFASSVEEQALDPAYQQIIGMGKPVLPLILAELERQSDHWFWALWAITGVDPVSIDDRGRVDRMRSAWLEWGRFHRHI